MPGWSISNNCPNSKHYTWKRPMSLSKASENFGRHYRIVFCWRRCQRRLQVQVVMGYHYHGAADKAVVEVCPISGKKSTAAASKAGLAASTIPTLLVQGNNKPGLGHAIAQAVAEAGINVTFLVAQVINKRFSAVMGFEDEAASKHATTLIKKAVKKIEK